MEGKFERYFVPGMIGLGPFILLLLTWAPTGRSLLQDVVLGYYLPVMGVELFTIIVALREGMIPALRRESWPRLPTAALLILLAIAIGTSIAALDPGGARVTTLFWLIHLLFGYSVAYLCGRSFSSYNLISAYLVGFAAFLAGAILFATRVTDLSFDWTYGWPAAQHIRHLGYYVAAMAALCIGLAATERRWWMLAALLMISVVGLAFAIWTGSRGTVVGVAGGVLVGLVLLPQLRRPIAWGGAALILALGAALAELFPAPASNMGLSRTVTATVDHEITTGRTAMWHKVLEAIERRPLFGYGEDQMRTVAPFYGLIQPHDFVLQVLLAWGAVGLLCSIGLAAWFLGRSLPIVRRGKSDLIPPLMAMFSLACFATIDGALFHFIPLSIFAACGGIVAAGWRSETAPK